MRVNLIDYLLNYGIRSTTRKVISLITKKIVPEKYITGTFQKSIKDIDNVKTISKRNMSIDYKKYIDVQIKKSVSRTIYLNPAKRLLMSRDALIQKMKSIATIWKVDCHNILSIGSRDIRELDNIQSLFKKSSVKGIDLFSASERIITADMHDIPFEDCTFDAVISIHCQEHSFDPSKSLGEMYRLARVDGLICIEVPINFKLSATDRVDYKNLQNLITYFPNDSVEIIWSEIDYRFPKANNLRVIMKKRNI